MISSVISKSNSGARHSAGVCIQWIDWTELDWTTGMTFGLNVDNAHAQNKWWPRPTKELDRANKATARTRVATPCGKTPNERVVASGKDQVAMETGDESIEEGGHAICV